MPLSIPGLHGLQRASPLLQLYRELSFRVVLVGLEIWNKDKFYISRHANVTLENFLSWREQNLLGQHPHDNVQLIT